jgi:hypothetical protein
MRLEEPYLFLCRLPWEPDRIIPHGRSDAGPPGMEDVGIAVIYHGLPDQSTGRIFALDEDPGGAPMFSAGDDPGMFVHRGT